MFEKIFFGGNERKMTENEIFRPCIEFFGHLKAQNTQMHNLYQFASISIENALIKCLGSTLVPWMV